MAAKKSDKIARKDKIYQLTTLVAGEFTLQEVLDNLAEGAVSVTGVTACSIRLLDDESSDSVRIHLLLLQPTASMWSRCASDYILDALVLLTL